MAACTAHASSFPCWASDQGKTSAAVAAVASIVAVANDEVVMKLEVRHPTLLQTAVLGWRLLEVSTVVAVLILVVLEEGLAEAVECHSSQIADFLAAVVLGIAGRGAVDNCT